MSPRVYVRKFDYGEAKRLRAEGLTCSAIAARFGVSYSAVWLAVNDDARRRMTARVAVWQRQGKCIECGKTCTRTGGRAAHRCQSCAAIALSTTSRPDALECALCHAWKPDHRFPRNRHDKFARRGRHGVCRDCQAAMRMTARHGRRIPCSRCGKLRSHPNDRGSKAGRDTGLCLSCFQADRKAA